MLNNNNQNAAQKEFALTPEIRNQLRGIAKQLPLLPIHVQQYGEVDGQALIDKGYESYKANGKSENVIIGKKYTVPTSKELRDISHIENLFGHYKAAGIIGVHHYILSLPEHEQKARENYPELFKDGGTGDYISVSEKVASN
jgi:hypothetical protein